MQIGKKLKDLYDFTIGRFISGLFRKPSSVLFLGIDNAGKTTLVNKIKNNANHVFLPTKHANHEDVEIGNLKAHIIDLGGHKAVRMAWKDYFYNVDGVVFIIDTYAKERSHEVQEAWASVQELSKDTPILVLMNKIDMLGEDTNSISHRPDLMDELEGSAGIVRSPERQNIEIVYLSILRESAFNKDSVLCHAFSWFSEQINNRTK